MLLAISGIIYLFMQRLKSKVKILTLKIPLMVCLISLMYVRYFWYDLVLLPVRYLRSLLTDIKMIEEFQPRDELARKSIDEVSYQNH